MTDSHFENEERRVDGNNELYLRAIHLYSVIKSLICFYEKHLFVICRQIKSSF